MMQPSYLQSIQTAPMALYHKMNNPIKKWAEDCLTSLYLTSLNMIISRFFYIATNVIISFFLLLSNISWYLYAAAAAKSLQSYLTLCDSMGCNPPGSSDHSCGLQQEYWSGWPCPPPGDLPWSRYLIYVSCLLHWQAGSLQPVLPGKPLYMYTTSFLSIHIEGQQAHTRMLHIVNIIEMQI